MRRRRCKDPRSYVSFRLYQVPERAVEILEHRHRAVRSLTGLAHEFDAGSLVGVEVAPEIIGVQEQEHSPSRLVADARDLLGIDAARQQQPGPLARSAGRLDDHPALILLG